MDMPYVKRSYARENHDMDKMSYCVEFFLRCELKVDLHGQIEVCEW